MSDQKWPKTYIEETARDIYVETLPDDEECHCYPAGEDALWLGYAVLCLSKGTETTSRDVHDAWSAWATVHHGGVHRSLIPFEGLSPEIQAYDDEYRDAIHRVALQRQSTDWGVEVDLAESIATRHAIRPGTVRGWFASGHMHPEVAMHLASLADYGVRPDQLNAMVYAMRHGRPMEDLRGEGGEVS